MFTWNDEKIKYSWPNSNKILFLLKISYKKVMSDYNLPSIDVDKLFEQHNVVEIDQIQKVLQREIDEKKEEIRVMVGERYRDLLQAADTITDMQTSSGLLLDQIKMVSNNCQRLNETQLFGFKTDSQLDKTIEKNMELYFNTNIRIRLLTLLPDLLWSRIDTNEYFVAAQIHILSQHIISSLKLESNNPFLAYFPVKNKIFNLVDMASESLRESVVKRLEKDSLDAEDASDCILSLYILDKTNLDKLLSAFLERRVVAYKRSLCEQDVERRVKDRILSSLKVLVSTVKLANSCFFSNETRKSLIFEKLTEYRQFDKKPTLSYIDYDRNDWMPFLPASIRNFRPSIEDPALENIVVEQCCSAWLKHISDISSTDLRNLIELITSMKVIQEIKKEVLNFEKDPQWPNKCQLFKITPTIDFYKDLYVPLINERVMNIITHSWAKCIDDVFEKVQSAIEEPQFVTEYEYLWAEDENDLPSSLNHALNQDRKDNRLLMKMKGYNENIVSICKYFDSKVQIIFSETNGLLEGNNKKNDIDASLVEFLKNVTQSQINNLITKLKTLIIEKDVASIVFVAKLLVALTELCPYLKACLTFSQGYANLSKEWSSHIGDKKNLEKWVTICNLIQEESFSMWKKFCDLLFIEFLEKNRLNENLSYRTILEDFVNWETIVIEEKDEQEKSVTSSIRIPSQPRITVHKFLFELTKTLNSIVPQTLPLNVLRYLISKLLSHFIEHFNKLINSKFASNNQNMALQLFFDLKFLQTVFTIREDKKLSDEFQKLTNILKSYIDPFDFELFHSYLSANVKKCIFRMQHQLGILLPYPESLNVLTSDLKGSANLIEKDPNVLTLSSSAATATWFPLLPVVTENKVEPTMDVEKDISFSQSS
ncbi:conserved oligomeric Golgi complex subunit 1 isoform X2 [Condylostylus longicornis]|uniref:conserved oligomeric Golgi complex subunit 1 isoform X2 n=1 Tax=Condylostylus longicornis TaxID=2530218 RepID=UPI00244DD509|nr:conserved oligomeric Golgi complex subunit 1 isoform X2 [Condylostylus longicornis]